MLELERFSSDPSFAGQIAVAPRDRYTLPAWSVNGSSTPSLVVNESQIPEDIVAATLNNRTNDMIDDVVDKVLHDAIQDALEPAPVVPVPPLAKYVTLTEVEVQDFSAQACGVASPLSKGVSMPVRKLFKVSSTLLTFVLDLPNFSYQILVDIPALVPMLVATPIPWLTLSLVPVPAVLLMMA